VKRAALTLALLSVAAAALPAQAQERLLHQERSLYRNIRVIQDGDERCMAFRARRQAGRQSCILLSAPDRMILEYSQMMLAGLYLNPRPQRVLIIGLGGGVLPTALQQMLPGAKFDVVELDAAVDRSARRYFNFKPGPNMKVTVSDGRVFVKRQMRAKPNYDLVILDAFEDDYIPEHMLTKEFLEEVKSTMAPNGVIVANTFSSSGLYDYESVTYRAVFGPFYNMKSGNRIIVGKLGGLPPIAEIRRNAAQWEAEFKRRNVSADGLIPMMSPGVDWDPKARILTDQYSPSNLLQSRRRG
jgi:spermidine synthase